MHILDAAHACLRVYRSFQVAYIRVPEGLPLPAQRPGHDYGAVPANAAPVESQVPQHAAAQTDARRLQLARRFDRGLHCSHCCPVAIGALSPAQILRLLGGLQWKIRIQHEVTEARGGMGLSRLDHNRISFYARLLADGRTNPVRVFAGDNGEIQDHDANAPPVRFEDDGLGKERIQNNLGRTVVTCSAARQMRPLRRGYVDHRRTGAQLVGLVHGFPFAVWRVTRGA